MIVMYNQFGMTQDMFWNELLKKYIFDKVLFHSISFVNMAFESSLLLFHYIIAMRVEREKGFVPCFVGLLRNKFDIFARSRLAVFSSTLG